MARGKPLFSQRDATRAAKAVVAAGLAVSRIEFGRDGRIIVVVGSAGGEDRLSSDALDRELADFEARHG